MKKDMWERRRGKSGEFCLSLSRD